MAPGRIVIDPVGWVGDHEFGCQASQQGGDQSLSNKLLGYGGDQSTAGVEKRETTTMKGVY